MKKEFRRLLKEVIAEALRKQDEGQDEEEKAREVIQRLMDEVRYVKVECKWRRSPQDAFGDIVGQAAEELGWSVSKTARFILKHMREEVKEWAKDVHESTLDDILDDFLGYNEGGIFNDVQEMLEDLAWTKKWEEEEKWEEI